MLDESNSIEYDIELNESTNEKKYIIKGIVSTPGERNKNGRIYPLQIWENNVKQYQNEIKRNTYNTLSEWEHPPRSTVDPMKAVAKCRKLEMTEDNKVYGEFVILNNNTPETNQIKALIDEGLPIGVSTRGVGRLGKNNIVEEYRLICTDLVASPSDKNANLKGLTESQKLFTEDWILKDKDFIITENNEIICDEHGCTLTESNKTNFNFTELLNSFNKYIAEEKEENEIEKFIEGLMRPGSYKSGESEVYFVTALDAGNDKFYSVYTKAETPEDALKTAQGLKKNVNWDAIKLSKRGADGKKLDKLLVMENVSESIELIQNETTSLKESLNLISDNILDENIKKEFITKTNELLNLLDINKDMIGL
jgi:hypothetical protein